MSGLLEVTDLRRYYKVRAGGGPFAAKALLRAVDGVSFRIEAGRTLGLVGESGCGKSTTGKLALGLIAPTSGSVRYAGAAMPPTGGPEWRALRRRIQMVYQDPYSSLNPRKKVSFIVTEGWRVHRGLVPRDS